MFTLMLLLMFDSGEPQPPIMLDALVPHTTGDGRIAAAVGSFNN